ncbi:hypothetical protein LCGC14_1580920 [marine sediment metagenome]|uniref:PhoU domain-containing protein n=1 Tax=marine sediment metagenome TaxID=412755 RepID=A0A0F9KXT7_9ZZZZ
MKFSTSEKREIRAYLNIELARMALDSLEELVRRGNKELDEARQKVAFFYEDILCLQSMISAIGHGLDYEDD